MSFKIAVIGCGWVARFGHGPACARYAAENPETELLACCDTDRSAAETFRKDWGFGKSYTDHKELISAGKPDAVCLNTPPRYTASVALDLLEHEIPLIMEKPPGVSLQETIRIREAASRYDVTHAIAWNRRSMPLVLEMKKLIVNRRNRVYSVHYEMSRVKRTGEDFTETAIHGIDTVRFLLGSDYRQLEFGYQDFVLSGKQVTNFHIRGEMESGTMVSLHFYPASGLVRESIHTSSADHSCFLDMPVWDRPETSGRITCYKDNKISGDHAEGGADSRPPDIERFGFFGEDKAFFDAVRRGEKPPHDLGSSLQVMEILDCMKRKQTEYAGA